MTVEIFDPLKAFDEGAEHARLQRVCTIAQLAHEWAKAYRAHHTRVRMPPVKVTSFSCSYDPPEEPLEWNGPHPETTKSANRLSAAARRLERACLGPRPKREALCPACGKGKDGCACTVEEREAAYTVTL